ncbi:MAG: ABC transporter permease [Spirochaetota bacterium]
MQAETVSDNALAAVPRKESLLKNIRRHPYLYLLALPGIVFFIMFRIVPSLGSVIAWQRFNIFSGILNSEWVGWKNFIDMVRYHNFPRILRNSLIIGVYKIVFTFPPPLILALMLNEVRNALFKRSVQTLVYMPHFLSWVVVSGIFISVLSPQGGVVNIFVERVLGLEPIFFMGKEAWFRPIVVISSIWKESGFESIIYLASIAAISHELYEAASIDGASRWQQLWRITLPSLLPTIVILLLLRVGRFLEIGFDQIYTLANPLVWPVADIFDTYVYRKGLLEGAYSITTAVNLFKTVVGFILLMGANTAAKRLAGRSLF